MSLSITRRWVPSRTSTRACLALCCVPCLCASSSASPPVMVDVVSNTKGAVMMPADKVPPGTPPCASYNQPVCVMPPSPAQSAGLPPPQPLSPTLRQFDYMLKHMKTDQRPGPNNSQRKILAFQAAHPETWPVNHTPAIVPGSPYASFCPGCRQPDGSVWAHQMPLMVGGRLYNRTPILLQVRPAHPWQWWACVVAFWSVLLGGLSYGATNLLIRRRARRHAAAVAVRRARAAESAKQLSAFRAGQPLP